MLWGVLLACAFLQLNCGAVPLEKILEVPEGHTVQVSCESRDGNHSFAFWELASKDILGPGNEYDEKKYEYNVLNGTLYVRNISSVDEGTYTCFSRDLDKLTRLNGRSIRMVVMKDWALHDHDPNTVNAGAVILLIGCVLVLGLGGYYIFKKWSREHRLRSLLLEDEEEEDSGEEIYTAPGTSKTTPNIILGSTKSLDESLSTDFGSILSAANK